MRTSFPIATRGGLASAAANLLSRPMPSVLVAMTHNLVSTPTATSQTEIVNSASLRGRSLLVTNGITYIIDLTKLGSNVIDLSGNLINGGTIYVVSTNPKITSVTIDANNILNGKGAVITTLLPASGLTGISGAVGGITLNLDALNNIVNAGTISSSGSLNLSAGTSIVNSGAHANMVAANNLSLSTPNLTNSGMMLSQTGSLIAYTSSLINSGTMQSLNNNLTIQALAGNTLSINNTNGSILANGNLTITTGADANGATALMEIFGGNLQANQLFFTSANGQISVNVDILNGPVNLAGQTAFIAATEGNLTIATSNLTGDPIFASSGTLNLSGLFASNGTLATYGGDFIALAGGDIIAPTAPANATINALANTVAGGQILLDAGTTFTVHDRGCMVCEPGVNYTIGAPTAAGGSIELGNVSLVTNNNAVTLISHAGSAGTNPDPGSISIGNISNYNNNVTTLNGGAVTISGPGAVSISSITNAVGVINVQSTQNSLTVAPNHAVQAFGGDVDLTAQQALNVSGSDAITSVGGNVNLTGNSVAFGTANTIGAWMSGGVGGNVNITANGNSDSATGNITSQGSNSFIADGGSITLTSNTGNISTGNGDTFHTCCAAGQTSAGNISLLAPEGSITIADNNSFEADCGNITVQSASAPYTGNVQTGQNDTFTADNSMGSGGTITISSPSGTTTLGNGNTLNAGGGNVIISSSGILTTGSGESINAFNQSGTGGSISLSSSGSGVALGDTNALYALGGNVSITAGGSGTGTVSTGNGDIISAYMQGVSGAGNLTITGTNNVTLGNSNTLYADNTLLVSSTGGNVSTGSGDNFQTCNGDISLLGEGSVAVGDSNTLSAKGGDIVVIGYSIATGTGDTFNAYQQPSGSGFAGGNIAFTSGNGGTTIGDTNTFNAVGGNLTMASGGSISTGTGDQFNAYNENGLGGNVAFTSTGGNVGFGNSTQANAVGGNLNVNANGVSFGSGGTYTAWAGPANTGNISVIGTTGDITSAGNNAFTADGGSISFNTYHGSITTGTGDSFQTCCASDVAGSTNTNDISLVSCWSNVTVGDSNNFQANGGDIIIEAAYQTGWTGNVVTGNNDTFDAFNCTGQCGGQGGNIHVYADLGNTTIGTNNTFNATGGNLTVTSSGPLATGSGNSFNSFNEASGGGNVTIASSGSTVTIGDSNAVNAVGGNVDVNGNGGVNTGNLDSFSAFAANPAGTVVPGAGNLTLAGVGNVALGTNSNFYADNTLLVNSTGGNVSTGSGNNFHTCAGNISVFALGSATISDTNTFNAKGGDNVVTGYAIATGAGDTFNAFQEPSGSGFAGGNNTFTSGNGGTTIGNTNIFNAVGGNNTLVSSGSITTGNGDQFNAYNQNGLGGNDTFTSTGGNVGLGNTNNVNAYGGNLDITANGVSFGAGGTYSAWSAPDAINGGNINVIGLTGDITSAGGNAFTADGGSIDFNTYHGSITTGTGDSFQTCCSGDYAGSTNNNDISLVSCWSNVTVGDNDNFQANGGDIIIEAAYQTGWTGNVVTGNNDTFDAFNCTGQCGGQGGNIHVYADLGNTTIGTNNTFNATGGNLTVTSSGPLATGSGNSFNSFNEASGGGTVLIASSGSTVTIGDSNAVNAVGGNVNVSGNGGTNTGNLDIFSAFAANSAGVVVAGAGNLTIQDSGNVALGTNSNFYADKSLLVNSTGGNVSTGSGNSFQTCSGDISMLGVGAVNIGDSNTYNAKGGDIVVTGYSITTGNNDTFNAFQISALGGNITFTSGNGGTVIGGTNIFNAVGGNIAFNSSGSIATGSGDQFNAYNENGAGGNVTFSSTGSNVSLGNSNQANAVGGNLSITANGVSFGSGGTYNAWAGPVNTGNSSVIGLTGDITSAGNNAFTADGGSISFNTYHGSITTGAGDSFQTCCAADVNGSTNTNDISLVSCWSNVTVADNNNFQANGGDIILEGAYQTGWTGNVVTGNNDTFDAFNCTGQCGGQGGNIHVYSDLGNTTIGNYNTFNAAGGNLTITSSGPLAIGNNNILNSFNQASGGGAVTVTSSGDSVSVGNTNTADAVGGNLNITGNGNVAFGSGGSYNAWAGPINTGNISVIAQTGNITSNGGNSFTADGGSITFNTYHGSITTGAGDSFQTCCAADVNGSANTNDISLVSCWSNVTVADNNNFQANGGDIILEGAYQIGWTGNVLTGNNDTFTASNCTGQCGGQGGDIHVYADLGNTTIGNYNTFNANGGNLTITSSGPLAIGNNNTLNSFNQASGGGNVTITSSGDSVTVGNTNSVNAVGGNLDITGNGNVAFGSGSSYNAWAEPANTGNISVIAQTGNITSNGGNSFTADGGSISFNTYHGSITTGTGDSFNTCCAADVNGSTSTNDINLVSCWSDVVIGDNNNFQANGGNIVLEGAYQTGWTGNVVTGNNDTFNAFNCTGQCGGQGGMIHVYADLGNTEIGTNNSFNATGGDLLITSSGPLSTGAGNSFNSFNQASGGGNVTITSSGSTVNIGNTNAVNAIGGNFNLTGNGNVAFGSGGTYGAWVGPVNTGNLTVISQTGDITSAGGNSFTADGGGINFNTYHGSIYTGNGDSFNTCCSTNANASSNSHDISLVSCWSNVVIGDNNNFEADGGNIILEGAYQIGWTGNVQTGNNDTFNANSCMGQGGMIHVYADLGNTEIGTNNTFNANGGDLLITSSGPLSSGSGNTFNSFNQSSGGGNVTIMSSGSTVALGNTNAVTAVGGNFNLTGNNTVSFGSGGSYGAWVGPTNTGNITVISQTGDITSAGGNSFTADGGGINFNTYHGSIYTGNGDSFSTCCSDSANASGNSHDVSLVSCWSDVVIGDNNTFEANGGDVILEGAYQIGWTGNVVTGNNDTFNAFSCMGQGGNVHVYADLGNTEIGTNNTFNAVGGNLLITSSGPLTTGSGNAFNSFNESSGGGNVTISSSGTGVTLGCSNAINAVGGNVSITGSTIGTGGGTSISAFDQGISTAGNVTITSNNNQSFGVNNTVHADRTMTLTSTDGSVTTGNGDNFTTCDGYIFIYADRGSITIGNDNSLNANNGAILLTSANQSGTSGNITTGSGDTFNTFRVNDGGSLYFVTDRGTITIGDNNSFSAFGGTLNLTSSGQLMTGSSDTFNAFINSANIGGNATLDSTGNNIILGTSNTVNAVGGNATISASNGEFTMGSGDTFSAFYRGVAGTGNVIFTNQHGSSTVPSSSSTAPTAPTAPPTCCPSPSVTVPTEISCPAAPSAPAETTCPSPTATQPTPITCPPLSSAPTPPAEATCPPSSTVIPPTELVCSPISSAPTAPTAPTCPTPTVISPTPIACAPVTTTPGSPTSPTTPTPTSPAPPTAPVCPTPMVSPPVEIVCPPLSSAPTPPTAPTCPTPPIAVVMPTPTSCPPAPVAPTAPPAPVPPAPPSGPGTVTIGGGTGVPSLPIFPLPGGTTPIINNVADAYFISYTPPGFLLSTAGQLAMVQLGTGASLVAEGYTVTTTPNGYTASTTPNGYTASTTPNGYTASATPNGYTATTTPNGYTATTTPNGYTASTTPNGYTASTTPNGYTASTTPNGYTASTTPNGYTASTTPNGYTATTTPNGYTATTTPNGYTASTTPNGYTASTTPNGYTATTTPNGYTATTTPNGYTASTTPNGYTASTTPNGYTATTTPNGYTASTTPNGYTASTTPNGYTASTTPNGYTASTTPNGYTATTTPNGNAAATQNGQIATTTTQNGQIAADATDNGYTASTTPNGSKATTTAQNGQIATNATPNGYTATATQNGYITKMTPNGYTVTTTPSGYTASVNGEGYMTLKGGITSQPSRRSTTTTTSTTETAPLIAQGFAETQTPPGFTARQKGYYAPNAGVTIYSLSAKNERKISFQFRPLTPEEQQDYKPTVIMALEKAGTEGILVDLGGNTYRLEAGQELLVDAQKPEATKIATLENGVVTKTQIVFTATTRIYPMAVAVHMPELTETNFILHSLHDLRLETWVYAKYPIDAQVAGARNVLTQVPASAIDNNIKISSAPTQAIENSITISSADNVASTNIPVASGVARSTQDLQPALENNEGSDMGDVEPISFSPAVITNARTSSNCQISQLGLNEYKVRRGTVLLNTLTGVQFRTQQGVVSISPNCIVLLTVNPTSTHVYDLWDNHAGDIHVATGGKLVSLRPGHEATMLDSTVQDPLQGVLGDGLARRDLEVIKAPNSETIIFNAFSIISAFKNQPLLSQLAKSADKSDCKLTYMIEKSAACIGQAIDRQHGPYNAMQASQAGLATKQGNIVQ